MACRSEVVVRHRRHWGKEHTIYGPRHYLALLERKPGALDVARPLEHLDLPASFALLRRAWRPTWALSARANTSRSCGSWSAPPSPP